MLFTTHKKILFYLFALIFVTSACQQISTSPTQLSTDDIHTRAASTIYPQLTLAAGQTAAAQLTAMAGMPMDTSTATQVTVPSATPDQLFPTSTSIFVASPIPTNTPAPIIWLPTNTPIPWFPSPTPRPLPCDWVSMIDDLNVPDGTVFPPSAVFTKYWRLKNIGSCTWNQNYALVFVSGDRMQGTKHIPLNANVRPGETIDIAVGLSAPPSKGKYRGYWMLRSSSGRDFGYGDRADKAFWVDIRVVPGSGPFLLDFAQGMCTASWQSSAGSLRCPSEINQARGSIRYLNSPVLENGQHENEQTLWMRPQAVRGGWIKGVYPKYTIQNNDHFMAEIGCLDKSRGCDVTFYLGYYEPGKAEKTLGTWREVYDRKIKRLTINLSDLAGKQVHFVLGVTNNGAPADADAFWLVPSIRRVSPTPVPSSTHSPTPTRTDTPTPTSTDTPTPTATSTATATVDILSLPAVQAARLQIAQSLELDVNQVSVSQVESVIWTDTCLEVIVPGGKCEPASIPGFKILLMANNRLFEAHTNLDGSIVYWFEMTTNL